MNANFIKLLSNLGWIEKVTDMGRGTYGYSTLHVKVFPITVGTKIIEVPISVELYGNDEDEYPTSASFNFVLDSDIRPNYGNRCTILKGRDRIICMLDYAGQMTAMKYVMFSHKVNSYKNDAKLITSNLFKEGLYV